MDGSKKALRHCVRGHSPGYSITPLTSDGVTQAFMLYILRGVCLWRGKNRYSFFFRKAWKNDLPIKKKLILKKCIWIFLTKENKLNKKLAFTTLYHNFWRKKMGNLAYFCRNIKKKLYSWKTNSDFIIIVKWI